MSLKITFSHRYKKLQALGSSRSAGLVAVLNVNLEELSPAFIAFDTDNGTYPLPKKGKYMLLLFIGALGMFPTLRRWTPQKEEYYRKNVGAMFSVELP